MTGGFGAIAAGAHIAPAPPAVFGAIEKHAMATRIGAPPNARQLVVHEGVSGGLDHRDHEAGERVAGGHKGPRVEAGVLVEPASTGAAAEHTVDLHHGIVADALVLLAFFGEPAQRGADPSGINQCRRGRGRLQHGSSTNPCGPFIVDGSMLMKPYQKRLEVPQQVAPRQLRGGVGVDEVKPESRASRHATLRTIARGGSSCVGEGD
jgi:hypothetical protein